MDIKKGDKISYSYYVYGVQCIVDGIVSSVKEDGSVVIDQGDNELIVEKGSILKRYPREDELGDANAIALSKSEEEKFNEMHSGVSIHKKEKAGTVEEPVKKEAESANTNKKFNHFGGK